MVTVSVGTHFRVKLVPVVLLCTVTVTVTTAAGLGRDPAEARCDVKRRTFGRPGLPGPARASLGLDGLAGPGAQAHHLESSHPG